MTELPLAELGLVEQLRICQIADLHDIDTGTDVGQIQLPHKVIGKCKVIDQTAVTNGGIQHFYIRTIGDHRPLDCFAHMDFLTFCFPARMRYIFIIPNFFEFGKRFLRSFDNIQGVPDGCFLSPRISRSPKNTRKSYKLPLYKGVKTWYT